MTDDTDPDKMHVMVPAEIVVLAEDRFSVTVKAPSGASCTAECALEAATGEDGLPIKRLVFDSREFANLLARGRIDMAEVSAVIAEVRRMKAPAGSRLLPDG